MTILDALDADALFRPFFKDPESWAAWRSFLAGCFALEMTAAELATFREHTGRQEAPTDPAREAWLVVGRRGGKSRVAALIAVWLATRDYRDVLAAGEVGTLPVIAADRQQARTVFGYLQAFLDQSPLLAPLVTKRTAESIELASGVRVEIHTASWRAIRGYTVVGAVLDEVAFWRSDDSANPDVEIVNALRPAMATVPTALLVAISSPHARRGVLWEQHRRHYGQDGDPVLCWRAPTRVMNPRVPESVIAEAYEQDPDVAAAEYGAEWRRDVEAFVSREALETCVVPDRHELPPVSGVSYVAFVDPSGGSADSMTLAVAHEHDGTVVVDAVREVRPPFSPEAVVQDFAALLAAYGITTVTGDRYAGEWPRERFAVHGITYEPSADPKSDLYGAFLPLLNSTKVELLDLARLHAQLFGLERRTARGGRTTVDHAYGARDDVANAVAGACVLAAADAGDCGSVSVAQGDYVPVMSARGPYQSRVSLGLPAHDPTMD